MTPLPDEFTISEEESAKFARFSGDFNPLHVDRLVARRLQFGCTVIHGVHHMLRAWDVALSKFGLEAGKRVASLHAAFPNPVSTGRQISCETQLSADSSRVEISASAGGKRVLSLTLGLVAGDEMSRHVPTLESAVPVEAPVDQEFPPRLDHGECQLHFDKALARDLFPNLARHCPESLLAQLIACTRIVGMKCPGLHSVFSGISLTFRDAQDSEGQDSDGRVSLDYRVSASDARMKLVKIDVQGPEIDGTLTAFFRPPPVEQPGYGLIRNEVPDDRFRTQRALVIGGSRGIGETTAKILAAGGADVTITYNSGEEDALKVERQISAGDGRCKILRYDAIGALGDGHAALKAGSDWTHVYYFLLILESHPAMRRR